jgi:hypothetical protein
MYNVNADRASTGADSNGSGRISSRRNWMFAGANGRPSAVVVRTTRPRARPARRGFKPVDVINDSVAGAGATTESGVAGTEGLVRRFMITMDDF